MKRVIFLVDMQSFYVSVEKADQPSLQGKPVVVAGDPERRSGIILAACPLAKQKGVKTAEPLWSAQAKCPNLIVVQPRMQRYIDISYRITTIFEQFTDLVEPYSIDEQFLDVTHSQRLFGEPHQIARNIQEAIMDATGVYCRVGIGPNKVLAKIACDNFAKKNEEGIFQLDESNMRQVMWPLPHGSMFGVGSKMRQHLERMGMQTIGDIATSAVNTLKKRWGINGVVLWQIANGIDTSPVTPKTHNQQKAIGHQMTLPYDYETEEAIKVILLELSEEVAYRARRKGYRGMTVSVGVRGVDFNVRTGFYRQIKLTSPTNNGMDIFEAAYRLFVLYWDKEPIRSASIALSRLQSSTSHQLNLFDNTIKDEKLNEVIDTIRAKYGRTSILRASSLTKDGQAFARAEKIGGHYK